MSSLNKKFMTFPLLVCFVMMLVCSLGFAGCSSEKVKVTLDANGGYFVTAEGNKESLTLEFDKGAELVMPDFPVHDPTNTKIYTFDGWDTDVPEVASSDITVAAEWKASTRYYDVVFKAEGALYANGSDTVSARYEYNAILNQPAAPTRAGNAEFTYEFDGYETIPPTRVTESATFIAKWIAVKNKYTVTFNANGGVIKAGSAEMDFYELEEQEYGTEIKLPAGYEIVGPAATESKEYVFGGWVDARNNGKVVTTLTGTTTVYAKWVEKDRFYNITFEAGVGGTIGGQDYKVVKMKYGETIEYPASLGTPVKPKTNEYEYAFLGFDIPANATVSGNATFTAVYSQTPRVYNVVFKAGEGYFGDVNTTTKTLKFCFGDVITPPSVKPGKESDAQYTYEFGGYTGLTSETTVTGEGMEFTATYTSQDRMYDVTFNAGDGYFGTAGKSTEVLKFKFGEKITWPTSDPTKNSSISEDYEFIGYAGWTEQSKVTGEGMTFVATYRINVREYLITFDANGGVFPNGESTMQISVKYGQVPEFDMVNAPEKESNNYADFAFTSWEENLVAVTGEATYHALYTHMVKSYTVAFYETPTSTTPLYVATFKASEAGTPELSAEQLAELAAAYRAIDPETGFAGAWRFGLANANATFYATNGGNASFIASYVFGDGTAAGPPLIIDGMDVALHWIQTMSDAYDVMKDVFNSEVTPSDEAVRVYNEMSNKYYRLTCDLDFTTDSDNPVDYSAPLLIGHIDAQKSADSNYAIKGLNSDYLSTGGALFSYIANAEISNLDIILGESIATFAAWADGDYVVYDNVNIYNADGVDATFLYSDDNNESAYLWHSFAKSTTFQNCTNNANYISQSAYFGIFLGGYTRDGDAFASELNYINCVNNGNVTASGTVGMLYGNGYYRAFNNDSITIADCVNNGVIKATSARLFVGNPSSNGVDATMATELDAMVTNSGTIENIPQFGTIAISSDNVTLTPNTGTTLDASAKYSLDVMIYARASDGSTVRVGYTRQGNVVDGNLVFDVPNYEFIDAETYREIFGSAALDDVEWSQFGGYSDIFYYADDENGYMIFDFSIASNDYCIYPNASETYVVTMFNGETNAIEGFATKSVKSHVSERVLVENETQLQNAIEKGNKTIILTQDIELTKNLEISKGKTYNLDLRGYTISSSISTAIKVSKGTLNVDNGIVAVAYEAFRMDGTAIEGDTTPAKLVLGADLSVTSQNDCCIFAYGPRVEVETAADLISHSAEYATIQGNGEAGKEIKSLTITGGSIISENNPAIYLPQYGEYNIGTVGGNNDDLVIQGQSTAVFIKCGVLNIMSGTFKNSANAVATPYVHDGNGWGEGDKAPGDVLVIEACDYPGGTPTVNITGGAFESTLDTTCGIAYYIYNANKDQNNKATINVSDEVMAATKTNFVAQIGTQYFSKLAEATEAVPTTNEQTTIKLLGSVQGSGVRVVANQNIVFDLNGNTYDIINPTVGSAGTETNGFQLLKGSTVTFKDGTITSSVAKILIQNYCILTVENVTFDTRENDICGYVLSNNNGSLTLKGNTNVYAADGKCAFDLWYGMSESYRGGITVTFASDFTGTINGRIEYGIDGKITNENWTEVTKIIIEDGCTGTFNGNIAISRGGITLAEVNITCGTGYEFDTTTGAITPVVAA